MQRPHSIDARIFLEVLHMAGCQMGPANVATQTVYNPEAPGYWTIVRLHEDMHTRTIEAHLHNLNISEDRFLRWFDHYANRSRS